MLVRSLATLAAALLLTAPTALAQDAANRTPLQPGARALTFGINPTAGLTGLDGGTIGVKWHSSEARAVRLGLTVAVQAQAETGGEGGFDRQSVLAEASVVPLRYARSRTPVYFYYGVGPLASVRLDRQNVDLEPEDSTRYIADVGAGALGVVGVEWPVTSFLSLTGEYGASLTATYSRLSAGEGSLDRNLVGIGLLPRGGRAGVAVYF